MVCRARMIHKHDLRTAISDLRQALEHVEHCSGRPEVFCLKQLLVNPLSYLLTGRITEIVAKMRQLSPVA